MMYGLIVVLLIAVAASEDLPSASVSVADAVSELQTAEAADDAQTILVETVKNLHLSDPSQHTPVQPLFVVDPSQYWPQASVFDPEKYRTEADLGYYHPKNTAPRNPFLLSNDRAPVPVVAVYGPAAHIRTAQWNQHIRSLTQAGAYGRGHTVGAGNVIVGF